MTKEASSDARKSAALCDLVGLAEPAHRVPVFQELPALGLVGQGLREVGVHEPGAQGVHPHALPGEVHGHVPGELDHPALAVHVRVEPGPDLPRPADEAVDRGQVHDRAATLLHHLIRDGPGHEKRALHVDGHHEVPDLLPVPVGRRVPGGHPGAVHEHVRPAESLHRLVDEPLGVGPARHVAHHHQRLAAGAFDLGRHGFQICRLQVGERHLRALLREHYGRRRADTRCRTRDQRHLVPKPARHLETSVDVSGCFTVPRRWGWS